MIEYVYAKELERVRREELRRLFVEFRVTQAVMSFVVDRDKGTDAVRPRNVLTSSLWYPLKKRKYLLASHEEHAILRRTVPQAAPVVSSLFCLCRERCNDFKPFSAFVTKRADNVRWFANLRDEKMLGELFALDFFVRVIEIMDGLVLSWSIDYS